MKVLIADKFQASGIDALEQLKYTVVSEPDASPDTLTDLVSNHDPDVLIVRSTKVPGKVFDAAKKLSLVVRAGAGYDNIDVEAASRNGISVANCPGKNAIAVAELAWGLILAADRDLPNQTADLKAGAWNKKTYAKKARGLFGATLGVIGIGHIGEEVIKRAHSFGMPVVAWSRSLDDRKAKALGVQRAASPADVAKQADVVSVHVAQTPDTAGMIDADFIASMKPGATLVNTARGGVVDQAAVADAVKAGTIRYAADVYHNQPAPTDAECGDHIKNLANLDGFVGTHHCGASTEQAQEATAAEAVRIIETYDKTGAILHIVNRQAQSRATRLLVVRHLNKAGVLAHVIGKLGEAQINIEEMENVIFQNAEAACAKIQLDDEPSQNTMDKIRSGNPNVLSVDLTVIK